MIAQSLLVGLMLFTGGDDPKTATLSGIVVDAAGKPIAGARVDIATAAPRFGEGLFCPSCYRDCSKGTRSDNQGRFEIGGLDLTLKFTVLISAAGKKAHWTKLIDPLAGDLRIALEALPANHPPEHTLMGRLVDDRSQPIAGALIYPNGAKTAERHWGGSGVNVEPAVSDDQGRFFLLLPKDYEAVDVSVSASGFAGDSVRLLKPGKEEHRIMVPAGTQVTGRLVHDGKPMAGLRVAVVQTDRGALRHFIKAVGAVTDENGRFRMERLPADQSYVIFTVVEEGPQKFVITTKKFKAYADRQERDLGDLSVITPLRIKGKIELPVGAKLPAGAKITLGRDPAWDLIAINIGPDGSFTIEGLPPEVYNVHVHVGEFTLDADRLPYQITRDSSFGLRLRESIDDLRIPLLPPKKTDARAARPKEGADPNGRIGNGLIGGTVVDPRGKPVAGAVLSVTRLDGKMVFGGSGKRPSRLRDPLGTRTRIVTEASGQFLFLGLPEAPLRLFAYFPEHGSKYIQFPVEIEMTPHDDRLRIVLDPNLIDETEDLDSPRPNATLKK